MSENDLSDSVIFPIGEKFKSNHFNGAVWIKMLAPSSTGCAIDNVTFGPGCRNNWHKHAGGQVLLITGGKGYYQEWGKSAQELHEGDVVIIPEDVKHWHGATRDNWFVHLSVEINLEKGEIEWLEPVADRDYNELK